MRKILYRKTRVRIHDGITRDDLWLWFFFVFFHSLNTVHKWWKNNEEIRSEELCYWKNDNDFKNFKWELCKFNNFQCDFSHNVYFLEFCSLSKKSLLIHQEYKEQPQLNYVRFPHYILRHFKLTNVLILPFLCSNNFS